MTRPAPRCRFCAEPLTTTFCDLGMTPLSNAYVTAEQLDESERFYPLHARVCGSCLLVQLEAFESPEAIFGDYAYFSSYSESWLEHARRYAEDMRHRLALGRHSRVIEVASNDGYLLQFFKAMGIEVLGVEPAGNVAAAAEKAGVPTLVKFFGQAAARELAATNSRADLLVGNNVLAHVPDLNDFVAGLAIALAPGGTLTLEFPHLLRLVEGSEFDTIYHEHFCYFSLLAAIQVLAHHGLRVFDVDELPTHGGSLRLYACRVEESEHEFETAEGLDRTAGVLEAERVAGLDRLQTYARFTGKVHEVKRALLEFLIDAKRAGKSVIGYGAAAKGNTLLNYCGIRGDFIDYVVDRNPYKQGRWLPGTRIPIHAPERIAETRPDYVLILPWNIREEIMSQMAGIRAWGGRFVVAIPRLAVL
jgi:SAM-dependent methyltransferase